MTVLRTALPLLLGLLGVGVVASRRERSLAPRTPVVGAPSRFSGRLRPVDFASYSGTLRPLAKIYTGPMRPVEGSIVRFFGRNTRDEYPAPYRFEDAREMAAIVLRATAETSTSKTPLHLLLVERTRLIDKARIPNWRKTYALILTVVFPAFSWGLLWHWYRPAGGVKEERFNAMISWAALFFSMPATATAASGIEVARGGSSLLPNAAAYLNPSTQLRRGSLTEREMRRCLYDISTFMRGARVATSKGTESIYDTAHLAGRRMADLNTYYPLDDPLRFVIQGNLKAVDEITWYANAIVQGSIKVDFDEAAAYGALAMRIVATLAQAASLFVSPQVASAINAAADAISTLSSLVAEGRITSTQLQAMAGAGVSMMISQAGIRLGLERQAQQLQAAGAPAGV